MLSEIKRGASDRKLIDDWLTRIGETDQACRDEVLDICAKDKEVRLFYVKKAKGEIL